MPDLPPELSPEPPLELLADRDDERLDVFVSRRLPGASRSEARRLIDDGLVRVESALERPSYRVRSGDLIAVHQRVAPPAQRAAPTELDLVYEDEHLAVLNKPAGLTVHPAPGERETTLTSALVHRWPQLAELGGGLRAGLVHRLDRDTTGLLMVAKTQPALDALQAQLRERAMQKRYWAVVIGAPDPEVGLIDAPLGRDPADPRRFAVVERGRSSQTGYRLLERFADAALVECELITGRTHQIRVHLAAIGHAVVGDTVYGAPSDQIERQALHARALAFAHPAGGEPVNLEREPPEDFQQLLEYLREGGLLLAAAPPRARRERNPHRTKRRRSQHVR